MTKKIRTVCAFFLLFILLFTAVDLMNVLKTSATPQTVDPDDADCVRVAFSMGGGINPLSTESIDEVLQSTALLGMELVYHEPENGTLEWQLNDLHAMMEEDLDYLIVYPNNNSILPDIMERANERNIQVILVSNERETGDGYAATIFIDAEMEGRLCALELIRMYGVNHSCNIIEILGPEDSAAAAARDKGFRETIESYSNFRIFEACYGGFDRMTAKNALAEIISSNPKGTFNAVFACSDEDGLGALQALKVAGYNPGVDINIVSVNGIPDVKKAIIAGEYSATVESARHLGNVAIDIISRIEKDQVRSQNFVIPYRVYNISNVSLYLANLY